MCYNVKVKVRVYAKLNLTLAVGKRQGKFHPIDSIVTSVDVFDTVSVVAGSNEVSVTCDVKIPDESNSSYLAAVAFRETFKVPGVAIYINKGIPVGAGMGGSSADAAAVVYCMCKLFGVDINSSAVHEICARLGSDINFMLHGGLARMRGKGDDLLFYKMNKPLYFALTTFDVQMSTAEVYSAFDKYSIVSQNPQIDVNSILTQLLSDVVALPVCRNDLQQAAQALNGYAKDYVSYTRAQQWIGCMTGSGSAYFSLFADSDQAQRAVRQLNAEGYNSRFCLSVPFGIQEIS